MVSCKTNHEIGTLIMHEIKVNKQIKIPRYAGSILSLGLCGFDHNQFTLGMICSGNLARTCCVKPVSG